MPARGRRIGGYLRAAPLALLCAALLVLTACSSDSGGASKLSLGLTGSTASHAGQPPTLAANGPSDAYAFVYEDQIWIHDSGKASAQQLTHLVLSAGAAISWGPLVWSPDGKSIAYALSESDDPTAAARTTGPVYVVSVSDGSVVNTPITGSLYGHTYAWFGSTMLFYSDGGGVKMYDLGDADPRVWPLLDTFGSPIGPSGNTYDNGDVSFGDISVTANYLYYTTLALNQNANLGTVGVAGKATLSRVYLNGLQPDTAYDPGDIIQLVRPISIFNGRFVSDLGNAYFDKAGYLVGGAWQISGDASQIVLQEIGDVNAKSGSVSSSLCVGNSGNGFDCGALKGAGSFPLANYPLVGISTNGSRIAFSAATLYTQTVGNGSVAKLDGVGWTTTPVWSNDGKRVAVTQFVSSSTDANGVPQVKLNIVVYDGQNSVTLVQGGQDLAWKP